jgi:hypothetical protein
VDGSGQARFIANADEADPRLTISDDGQTLFVWASNGMLEVNLETGESTTIRATGGHRSSIAYAP